MAEFEIKVQELDLGGKEYTFSIAPSWLDSMLEAASKGGDTLRRNPAYPNGVVTVRADKSGEDVLVRGRVVAHLCAECSRCLADAPIDVDTELTVLFEARSAQLRPSTDEEDMTPEELDRETYSGDTVTLDDAVREQMLLEVPMQPLCRENCPGIEVPEAIRGPADLQGAVRDTVDPRMAPLRGLLGGASVDNGAETPDSSEPRRARKQPTAGKKRKN